MAFKMTNPYPKKSGKNSSSTPAKDWTPSADVGGKYEYHPMADKYHGAGKHSKDDKHGKSRTIKKKISPKKLGTPAKDKPTLEHPHKHPPQIKRRDPVSKKLGTPTKKGKFGRVAAGILTGGASELARKAAGKKLGTPAKKGKFGRIAAGILTGGASELARKAAGKKKGTIAKKGKFGKIAGNILTGGVSGVISKIKQKKSGASAAVGKKKGTIAKKGKFGRIAAGILTGGASELARKAAGKKKGTPAKQNGPATVGLPGKRPVKKTPRKGKPYSA